MIDIKSLLPLVARMLPGVPPAELATGIQQFAKAHPDLSNLQALQALSAYLQQQKQSQQPLFKGLMGQLPTGAK